MFRQMRKVHFSSFDLSKADIRTRFALLSGGVVPRPIALASTLDAEGKRNLSPFSFFNVFSSSPPILVFSPARSARDLNHKDTLLNVQECPEVVVNIVSYAMAEQVSLASTTYPRGVDEFEKSGLTPLASKRVKPYRVAESPVHFECKVNQIIALGEAGGAGNLVVAEILEAHVHSHLLDEKNRIDPAQLDAVARLGANWYARISKETLFEIKKPVHSMGLGVDALPDWVKKGDWLTGNALGRLGGIEALPTEQKQKEFASRAEFQSVVQQATGVARTKALEMLIKEYVQAGDIESAWCAILQHPSHGQS